MALPVTNSTTVGLSLSSGSLGGVGGPSVSASLSFGKSATDAKVTTDVASISDTRAATAATNFAKGKSVAAPVTGHMRKILYSDQAVVSTVPASERPATVDVPGHV